MSEVADRIFQGERLESLLKQVLDVSDDVRQRKRFEVAQCEERLAEAQKRLANLHDGIEVGTLSARDPDIAIRIKERRNEIDGLNRTARMLRQQLERGPGRITPSAVSRFGSMIRNHLLSNDNPAKQEIARAFIKQCELGPESSKSTAR